MDRFSYLERHGDVQMLALLSCVFKDPFRNTIAVTGITPVSRFGYTLFIVIDVVIQCHDYHN